MSIRGFFSPSCETRELNSDPELRTRYYRNNFKQVIEVLNKLAEKHHLEVREVNVRHKEVYMIGNGYDCIVTISQMNPIESGVDLKINFFAAIGFNRPKKKALQFYEDLKGILNFKGVSLHP